MNLKRLVKKNSFLTNIGYLIRGFRGKLHMKKFMKEPVDFDKVIFYADRGRYRCNPKAIAEYIHSIRPKIKLIWVYTDTEFNYEIPKYYRLVKFESNDYYREMATAGTWIFNLLMPQGTNKRTNQLYIQTWHGDKGFKKMAMDAVSNANYKRKTFGRHFIENEICDYTLISNKWFIPIYRRSTGFNGKFIEKGLPRNDCLFVYDKDKILQIKQTLSVPEDVKVLLYAPTFRDHKKNRGDIGSNIDLVKIIKTLEKKDGVRWFCLMRSHNGECIDVSHIESSDVDFLDVSQYADASDLLQISDMLITDYSSVAGDFALTGKPILLYQDDIDSYSSQDRGLYFNIEDSPYMAAKNMDEALNIINRITEEDAKENDKAILDFYGCFESGHATETVCSIIFDFIDKHKNI